MIDRFSVKMFDIELFQATSYLVNKNNKPSKFTLEYNNVLFQSDSMEQFNECTILKDDNGKLTIIEPSQFPYTEKSKIVWEGFITDIPEVKAKLLENH